MNENHDSPEEEEFPEGLEELSLAQTDEGEVRIGWIFIERVMTGSNIELSIKNDADLYPWDMIGMLTVALDQLRAESVNLYMTDWLVDDDAEDDG